MIAPNVQIYTATHPIELNERLPPVETPDGIEYVRHTYALPVTIEDGCWIGGGVIILPGYSVFYSHVMVNNIQFSTILVSLFRLTLIICPIT